MIRIGFSTSDWWVSRVIRWFTRAKVSHAFFLLDGEHGHQLFGDLVLEAEWCGFDLSTRVVLTRGSTRIVALVESIVPLDQAIKVAGAWLKEQYDYEGLFGESFVSLGRRLGKKWRNPLHSSRAMFCSEAIVYVLREAKYPGIDALDPASTSPEDLWEFLQPTKALPAPSVACPQCEGNGSYMVNAHGPQEVTCESCNGTGEVTLPAATSQQEKRS